MPERLTDLHVRGTERLITPRELKRALPLDDASARVVASGRAAVRAILEGRDPRLLAIVGPYFSPHPFDELDWDHMGVPPQMEAAHWLGTDRLGRDLFVRDDELENGVLVVDPPEGCEHGPCGPKEGTGCVGQLEWQLRHSKHAGDNGNDGAHRPDEVT